MTLFRRDNLKKGEVDSITPLLKNVQVAKREFLKFIGRPRGNNEAWLNKEKAEVN
jgi:hypothetical protein